MSRENLALGFPTMSDINWVVQLQKMTRGLKSRIKDVDEVDESYYVAKTKALIS